MKTKPRKMKMRDNHQTLREFGAIRWRGGDKKRDAIVTKREFDDIQEFVLKQQAKTDEGGILTPGFEKLTAGNFVGVLQTKTGLTIEILPKIDVSGEGGSKKREKEIFLKMLRAWRGNYFREMSDADVRALRHFPLLEVFISMFTKELLTLIHRGLARSYTPVEENLNVLKGKLMFSENLRDNLIHRERFYVRHEEFSANRPVNRLLKSAILRLRRLSRDTGNQIRLRQARFYFDEVPQSHNIPADFQRARLDRTMMLYQKLLPWMRLFLQGYAPSTYHGGHLSTALLFPMERIFEDYVSARLRREWSGWEIRTQDKRHHLVEENSKGRKEFSLRPDIVARGKGELRIIDAKWKQLNREEKHHGINQSDLYQMFAYGKKYQEKEGIVPTLYLLYPKNIDFTGPIEYHFGNGLRLLCAPVDIADESTPVLSVDNALSVAA